MHGDRRRPSHPGDAETKHVGFFASLRCDPGCELRRERELEDKKNAKMLGGIKGWECFEGGNV